jgi:small GTP-binding protein
MASKMFKVVFLGDDGVGKSAFIQKYLTNTFESKYKPTIGAEVYPVDIGSISIAIWDTAGQEKYSGLREGYYNGADAAVVFFSNDSAISFKNVPNWIADFKRICPDKPIIVVRNKTDVKPAKGVTRGLGLKNVIPISVKTSDGIATFLTQLTQVAAAAGAELATAEKPLIVCV